MGSRTQGYLAFAFGVCMTAWTCLLVMEAQDVQIKNNFQRDTDKVAADTGVRLQTYFDMLLSLKGLYASNDHVSRAQFQRFVDELHFTQRYPGFQAIQFVRFVPSAQLESFAEGVRSEGYARYDIHPKIVSAEHYVIEYNEPMKGNESAFGLDLAALEPHAKAVVLGRDTGAVIATARVTLVQDKQGLAGFVARVPIYRNGMPTATPAQRRAAFTGLVAIVFRVKDLMNEVVDPALRQNIGIEIHDTGSPADAVPLARSKDSLMYDSLSGVQLLEPRVGRSADVRVAQRIWHVEFQALGGGRYQRDLATLLIVALAGGAISVLVAALLMSSRHSRGLAARLRSSLDEQRAFQDSASVGIAMFAHGRIDRCNRGLEEIMGFGPGELHERPTGVLLGTPAAPDPFAVDPGSLRWQCEMELVRKDGSTIWCLINGKPMGKEDLADGGVWVIQDISARKHAEAALMQAQANLIQSEKMASLGALVAGIAHELNTPIGNSLLTATALADMVRDFERDFAANGVKRSKLEQMLADARHACGIMAGSLRRAADLITSFKQVAVDQTSDQRRQFDLCEVVRDTLTTHAAQMRRAGVEMRIDAPLMVQCDSYPGSMSQVLSNLINNAMLHAFEGRSKGLITVRAREPEEGKVELVFSDDGAGMSARTLTQIFDPFFTTKLGQGGSGLGMNIVYNIVNNILGGTIEIESVAGQGTSVRILIPTVAPVREAEHIDLARSAK